MQEESVNKTLSTPVAATFFVCRRRRLDGALGHATSELQNVFENAHLFLWSNSAWGGSKVSPELAARGGSVPYTYTFLSAMSAEINLDTVLFVAAEYVLVRKAYVQVRFGGCMFGP